MIAKRIYLTGLDELDKVYEAQRGDLRAGIREIERTLKRNPKLPPMEVLAVVAARSAARG